MQVSRFHQINLIKRINFNLTQNVEGISKPKRLASASSCKATLKAIDDYGRGTAAWPSIETLALDTDLSTRQISSCIARLKMLGFLSKKRRKQPSGIVGNVYVINWQRLSEFQQDRGDGYSYRPAISVDQQDNSVDEHDMKVERQDESSNKPDRNEQNRPPTGSVVGDKKISQMLQEIGCTRYKYFAEEFSDRHADVQTAYRVWLVNKSKIGAGAVIAWLRDGIWPEKNLMNPDRYDEIQNARKIKAQKDVIETRDYLAHREAKRLAKLHDWTIDQIYEHVQLLKEDPNFDSLIQTQLPLSE